MNGFEKRAEQKKQDIIHSSIELFKTLPPAKVSIRDIAKKAHVSVVTIYNYFDSKEGVIHEVVRSILTEQMEQAQSIIESHKPFPEKLKELIFVKSTLLTHFHPEFLQLLLTDHELSTMIQNEFMGKTDELVEVFIETAKAQGEICANLPTSFILRILELYKRDLSSEHSILLQGDLSPSNSERILHTLLYGIMKK
ncbi:TetR/AcrR family transcriptional regulator [Ammoniphilus sp. CFH 90114]|uniref:TetR/AcrR family transcriptional regulator n=1 Tax=Ammoniphilus sp. CFH 90114 TaxID=2493665 RepID=UPI0013E95C58|nr:TetR/AcrR family transcriptional regulator [Ammoniphilus sp. CFH 90114]